MPETTNARRARLGYKPQPTKHSMDTITITTRQCSNLWSSHPGSSQQVPLRNKMESPHVQTVWL